MSKGMVGRRLVACSELNRWYIPDIAERTCNEIVNGLTVVWDKAVREAEAVGQAFLTPIKALISTIETKMEELLGTLENYFKKAIEELLGALSEVGEEVATALKRAMHEILESCVSGFVPSCLIGPPGGCGDGNLPVWESELMELTVSHFHSCCG